MRGVKAETTNLSFFAMTTKPAILNFHHKMTTYFPLCRVAYLCCDEVYQSFSI